MWLLLKIWHKVKWLLSMKILINWQYCLDLSLTTASQTGNLFSVFMMNFIFIHCSLGNLWKLFSSFETDTVWVKMPIKKRGILFIWGNQITICFWSEWSGYSAFTKSFACTAYTTVRDKSPGFEHKCMGLWKGTGCFHRTGGIPKQRDGMQLNNTVVLSTHRVCSCI